MKILAYYRSRKYFMRMLLSFTLLVSILLITCCSLLYSYAKNTAMDLQQESTRKVLRQVNYNIDNLYETVANLTVSTFSDRDISVLMQTRDIEIFELYNRLQKFDYVTNTNLFVDSMIIYNAHNSCYYLSTRSIPMQCEPGDQDNVLKTYLGSHPQVENMKLVPISVREGDQDRQIIAMFKQVQGSVLMVNVKTQWIFDNVRAINDLADRMLGEIVIMDAGNTLLSMQQEGQTEDDIRDMTDEIRSRGGSEGNFTFGSGKDKKMVMYITSNATGWKLAGIQSYQVIFGSLSRIGTYSLFLLLCFIFLSMMASTIISMRLYKPIGSLIQSIRGVSGSSDGFGSGRDELSFLTSFNQRMLENLAKLETGKKATESIAKDYLLRRLLLERKQMNSNEVMEQVREHDLKIAVENAVYIVCLVMICDLPINRTSEEQNLLKFAVRNIAEEILGQAAMNESLALGDDTIALLLSASSAQAKSMETGILDLIGKFRDILRSYYGIEIGVSVSAAVPHRDRIGEAYEQALLQFEYRMIYGKTALLTHNTVSQNERNAETQIDYQTEKKWLENVRSGNMGKIEAQFMEIFKELSAFRHDHLLQNLQYLTAITVNMLKEMNVDKAPSVKASLLSFNRRVLEQETLDDVLVVYMRLFQEIADSRQTSTEDKNRILAEALKEAVEKHYADPNLSLQFLASKLKMSSAHISKVFRQCEPVSLNDYINKVRITHAIEQLQNTDQTISQIMYNVGFVSESYFYKMFKTTFGLTPREFRTRQILNHE
ncbi:helix-turn-helix domain-containing protein [Cohnella endophytica]|nr:helix-turn-helix domain-containing protein [Cohnella endophytica]